jgi:hypothetical protein
MRGNKINRFAWLSLGFLLLLSGCDGDNSPPTTGEVTITSELILEGSTYTFNGFSFELGKVVYCNPQSCKHAPDLIVIPDNSGEEIIAYLEILNNVQEKPLMALAGEFADWTSAMNFFNNYKQIADSLSYTYWAKPALEYQVWVIKTLKGQYGKIVIKDVVTFLNGTTPYAEITFNWAYQPDGSTLFD